MVFIITSFTHFFFGARVVVSIFQFSVYPLCQNIWIYSVDHMLFILDKQIDPHFYLDFLIIFSVFLWWMIITCYSVFLWDEQVLSAYVKSIEDHGYTLHFGLTSFSGFLPKINQSGNWTQHAHTLCVYA